MFNLFLYSFCEVCYNHIMRTNWDYYSQRNHDCQIRIKRILKNDLPDFCQDFFVSLQSRTSALTRLNYAYDLRTFFSFAVQNLSTFIDVNIKDIKLQDLNKFSSFDLELFVSHVSDYVRTNGKNTTNSERGKARKLSAVKALFKYFFKRGDLDSDISAKVNSPKIREKEIIRLERPEVSDFLDVVDSGVGLSKHQQAFHDKNKIRDMAIVALFLGTGIRVSELVGLDVNDFDMGNNSFIVTRKGGNRVILYLNDEIKSYLTLYLITRNLLEKTTVQRENIPMFLSMRDTRLTTRAVENIIKKYAKVAVPLKKITPHKLRSTFGTELYRATGDIYVVADVLGHKDVNTTKKHYAALSEDVRRKASQVVSLRDNNS